MKNTLINLAHSRAFLFDHVRRILAEARSLLETTDELIALLHDSSLKENDVYMQVQHVFTITNKIISERKPQVQKYFDQMNTLLEQYPEINVQSGEDLSSDITLMRDAWEKALLNWPDTIPEKPLNKPELLFLLNEVEESLYTLSVKAQTLTFPDLVNQRLLDMRTGEKLDFYLEFTDEVYKPEFLPIAWQYLREHSHRINGFMTENGIIYRASPFMPHWLSLVLINGVVALGFVLIWLTSILFPFVFSPSLHVPIDLFRGYIAVMAGGLVHTFVGVWKQYRADPDHAASMLGNLLLWIHVKQVSILSGILTLWTGFIILVVISQIQITEVAFLAGYSIDSFIDVFLVLFTYIASQKVAKWGSQNLPKSTRQRVADVVAQSKSGSLPSGTIS